MSLQTVMEIDTYRGIQFFNPAGESLEELAARVYREWAVVVPGPHQGGPRPPADDNDPSWSFRPTTFAVGEIGR